MNDRKIIMMPGSVYNEHVDQQNIFPALRQVENKFSENGACTAEEVSAEAGTAVDDKIRLALQVMRQEEVLKYGYDYAWVMLAMDGTAELPHFKSVQSFLEYLRQTLGLDGLPGESSLSKKVRDTRGRHPNWTFADTDDARECTRRNNVASRFLSLFRKGK